MNSKEGSKYYKFRLLFIRIRHGLFLFTLRNFIARFGIDLSPYYWVVENALDYQPPKIKDSSNEYTIKELKEEDLDRIKGVSLTDYKGSKILGLMDQDQLAVFNCIKLQDFDVNKKKFMIYKNEAYLFNMYTFQNYRGRNLAPYLRHLTYQHLSNEGIEKIYSITDYFNHSSHKFKKKLGAKPKTLYLTIGLFKKYYRTFLLKRYS